MSVATRVGLFTTKTVRMAWLLALVAAAAGGCTSQPNIMSQAPRVAGPEQGKALVTFIRPSGYAKAFSFDLWDGQNFVGVLQARACIQYQTTPGEHYFLAKSENWSCVKADLAAGKQYVIKANPVLGMRAARVALDPVTQADYRSQAADVTKWLAQLEPMAPDPQQVEAYAQSRRAGAAEARTMFQSGAGKAEILAAQDYLPQ